MDPGTEEQLPLEIVMRLRHDIQYAADTGWPWWGKETTAPRRDFLLLAGRPFTGTRGAWGKID